MRLDRKNLRGSDLFSFVVFAQMGLFGLLDGLRQYCDNIRY